MLHRSSAGRPGSRRLSGKRFSTSEIGRNDAGGRSKMDLELAETVERLRAELAKAATAGADKDIQFPVGSIQLELHVAVKKETKADAKVKVWVVEAGGSAGLSKEETHKITISL